MGPPTRKGTAVRTKQGDGAARSQPANSHPASSKSSRLSNATQQRILDVFRQAFPILNQDYDFKSVLQEVKGHLYNRDFQAAFGKREHLEVYAARWSAARALAYADIFTHESRRDWFGPASLGPTKARGPRHSDQVYSGEMSDAEVAADTAGPMPVLVSDVLNVACIGGGAGAELVALATVVAEGLCQNHINIHAMDIADWDIPIQNLYDALTTVPSQSGHTHQADIDTSSVFVDQDKISLRFMRGNILGTDTVETSHAPSETDTRGGDEDDAAKGRPPSPINVMDQESSSVFSDIDLVTIMFTLNELFASSLPKTTKLLLHLTDSMRTGSHLVVVDSPGSYSEIRLGKTGELKKYPMKWLLDHTLLNVAGEGRWEKIEEEDSLWFRLDDRGKHLRYPIDLENCRYQIHVYKKR